MLSDDQLKTARNILVATGQVFLASLVVPYFIGGHPALSFVAGTLFTAGSWSMALVISKNK